MSLISTLSPHSKWIYIGTVHHSYCDNIHWYKSLTWEKSCCWILFYNKLCNCGSQIMSQAIMRHCMYYDLLSALRQAVIIFHHQWEDSGNWSSHTTQWRLDFQSASSFSKVHISSSSREALSSSQKSLASCLRLHGATASGPAPTCQPSYGLLTGRRWMQRIWLHWKVFNNNKRS